MIRETTIKFLKDLKKNNNREWFEANKGRYETAKKDFEAFIALLIAELAKQDPRLQPLQPNDCVFRIYRDVRFSKNKDPYKTNFAASIKPGGRKSAACGLYIHLEPSGDWGSLIAGGYWMPEAPLLKKLRQEIEYNFPEFESILRQKSFKKYFSELEEHTLKRVPKGFPADHPAAAFLKYTGYIVTRQVDTADFTKAGILKECAATYKAMLPLLNFLNRVND